MSEKRSSNKLRTWIEIDSRAAAHNYRFFRSLLDKGHGSRSSRRPLLFSVVKSNAYGHGLLVYSLLANKLGVDGFCVDSLVEGLTLRREGIVKPLLVLGATLPSLLRTARAREITLSISDIQSLVQLSKEKQPPEFHLVVDTGMHRRGFYPDELSRAVRILNGVPVLKTQCRGAYTHFASAKDLAYPTYTEGQFKKFREACARLKHAGLKNLIAHACATGGTLLSSRYHLDAVRVGIGLYGLFPSKELEIQFPQYHLKPVLSWRAVVSEVKPLKAGDYVGYDLTERVTRPTLIAVIPVGYWHGFPWALSGIGTVLVHGRPARVLGRVSMDMIVVDVTGISVRPGDRVTLIGADGKERIAAPDVARRVGGSYYELVTRLNPLMERIVL